MANGFIDGVGYPMNGGLAAGFTYGQKIADEQRRRGLASGISSYVNATDDASRKNALNEIARNNPQAALDIYNSEREIALKDRITPYQAQSLEIQRKQLENQGKMNEYQTWQKEEALRKEQEAKEKEMAFGQAISEFYAAKDDEGRSAALSKAAIIDPKATSDIYKKVKTQEALEKGWTTDTGRLWDIYTDPNQPEEDRRLAGMILQAKASDPNLKGTVAYQTEIGKQAAQAGIPYGNVGQVQQEPVQSPLPSTFGLYTQEQAPQAQAMSMQAQPIPTAAFLEQDKKTASKIGEFKGNQQIDELKGWTYVNGQKKALKGSEAEREWMDKNIQALKNNEVVSRASNTVLSDIDAILRLSEGKGYLASGFLASSLNGIPGTTAADIAARVESIKGNIAVDSLLNIKKSGAGLGQVPQKQAEMLSGLLGNLSQNQSPSEFVNVLKRIRGIYSDIVNAAEKENRDIMSRIYDPNSEQFEQPKEENVISAEEWFNQGGK